MNKNFIKSIFIKSDNEELSQAFVRLIFLLFLLIYMINNFLIRHQDKPAVGLGIFFTIYALIHYRWIKKNPSEHVTRRIIAIFIDTTAVSFGIFYMGWVSLFMYPVYLWIIVGNGMRFGSNYLLVAMALAFIEFGVIQFIHPFWIQNPQIGLGLLGVIVLLPLFFLIIVKRLQLVNKQLKEQLELQKRQEMILMQQSRHAAMGEMISNIAHQWRQPLNALSLLLQNMEYMYEMNMLNDEYMSKTITKGTRLTQTMSKTIDDFRDFFKPNKEKKLFNIAQVINNSLSIIEAGLINHEIEIITELNENDECYGYSNEFSQVLLNILANAKDVLIDKKIKEPKIWIISYNKENSFVIKIKDNGGGLSEDIISKVFDPYFTTKDEGKGTGIGLYMSKLIVEEHLNGKISVKNIKDGAAFSIILKKIKPETGV